MYTSSEQNGQRQNSSSEASVNNVENVSSSDDFGSTDEVKVFKDEGEDKEFAASHEELQAALSEDKSSLIQETELSIKQEALRISDPGGKSTLCIFNQKVTPDGTCRKDC